ncbi:MAG: Clp protease N-terminal domain-containing protein [Sedimentisphaerales bacterium]|nr:Clp protease N-terminal domain-containing protein [Sedimentisphaerales bacterium]
MRRGDLWVNLIQTLLQIVYFYNPLLWLANAMIRRTREQAVDEAVLVAMGETARDYPETLLHIAKLAFHRRPALSLRLIGVVESKSALRSRIQHILARPFPKSAKLGTFSLIAIVATAAVLLPMAKGQRAQDSTDDSHSALSPDAVKSAFDLPKAILPDGIAVELAGLSEHPSAGREWWRPDGSSLDEAPHRKTDGNVYPNASETAYEFAVRLHDLPDGAGVTMKTEPGGSRTNGTGVNGLHWLATSLSKDLRECQLLVGVAAEPWETTASTKGESHSTHGTQLGGVMFSEAVVSDGDSITIAVTDDIIERTCRVVAVMKDGRTAVASPIEMGQAGKARQSTAHFKNVALSEVAEFQFQTRPWTWVTFRNVSLKPGHETDVVVDASAAMEDGTPQVSETEEPPALPLTARAEKVMPLAEQEARRLNHAYVGTEHILLALARQEDAVSTKVMVNLGADLDTLRTEVNKFVQPGPAPVTRRTLPRMPRAERVVQHAVEEAKSLGHDYIGTEHLLLALMREPDSVAAQVLADLGITHARLRAEVLNFVRPGPDGLPDDEGAGGGAPAESERGESAGRTVVLPEADRVGLILDLATGELVALPPTAGSEVANLQKALRDLGQGDIVYDVDLGDRTLVLLRDATSEQAHEEPDESGNPYGFIGPDWPETLIVTTAEGRRYKIAILAADDEACTLKYSLLSDDEGAGGGALVDPPEDRSSSVVAELPNDVTVELLAYSQMTADGLRWWTPDGEPTMIPGVYEADVEGLGMVLAFRAEPDIETFHIESYQPPNTRTKLDKKWRLDDSGVWLAALGEQDTFVNLEIQAIVADPPALVPIGCGADGARASVGINAYGIRRIANLRAMDQDRLRFDVDIVLGDPQVIAVLDETGKPHSVRRLPASPYGEFHAEGHLERSLEADLPADQFAGILVEGQATRGGRVNVRNVSLDPDRLTQPLVEVVPGHQGPWWRASTRFTLFQGLAQSLTGYAEFHDGRYPDSLADLDRSGEEWIDQQAVYLGSGQELTDNPPTVIAYEKTLLSSGSGTYVAYSDGDIQFNTPPELAQLDITQANRAILRRTPAPEPVSQTKADAVPLPAVKAELPNGVTVEFLAYSRLVPGGGLQWLNPQGHETTIPGVYEADVEGLGTILAMRVRPPEAHLVAQLYRGPDSQNIEKQWQLPGTDIWLLPLRDERSFANLRVLTQWTEPPAIETIPLTEEDLGQLVAVNRYGIASIVDLQVVESFSADMLMNQMGQPSILGTGVATAESMGLQDMAEPPMLQFSYIRERGSFQKVAAFLDQEGRTHPIEQVQVDSTGTTYQGRIWPGRLAGILVEASAVRAADVRFRNISLTPERITEIQIEPAAGQEMLWKLSYRHFVLEALTNSLRAFCERHGGRFPASLADLQSSHDPDAFRWITTHMTYVGQGKATDDDPPSVIAYDQTLLTEGQGTYVFYSDGRVEFECPQELGILVPTNADRSDGGARNREEPVLQFRIVPKRGDIDPEVVREYVDALEHGRSRPGDDYAWFETLPGIFISPDAVTHECDGKGWLLLWNRGRFVMQSSEGWKLDRVDRIEDNMGRPAISLWFDASGMEAIHALTEANVRSTMACVVDGQVVAAPTIVSPIEKAAMLVGHYDTDQIARMIDLLQALTPMTDGAEAVERILRKWLRDLATGDTTGVKKAYRPDAPRAESDARDMEELLSLNLGWQFSLLSVAWNDEAAMAVSGKLNAGDPKSEPEPVVIVWNLDRFDDRWVIADIDLEPIEALQRENARFLQNHPGAQVWYVEPGPTDGSADSASGTAGGSNLDDVENRIGQWQETGVSVPPDANDARALTSGIRLDGIGSDPDDRVFISTIRDTTATRDWQYRFVLTTKAGETLEPIYYGSFELDDGKLWEKYTFDTPYHHRKLESFHLQRRLATGQVAVAPTAHGEILSAASDAPASPIASQAPPGRYALSFDGRDDYLYIPDSRSLRDARSLMIEMWLKPQFPPGPYDHRPGWALLAKGGYLGTGRVSIRGFGVTLHKQDDRPDSVMFNSSRAAEDSLLSTATLWKQPDDWMHISERDSFVPAPGYPLVFGRFLIPTENPFQGEIAEIRIWDITESGSIERYENAALTGNEPGLLACWTFEEGAGPIARDISPHANHARLGSSVAPDYADPTWLDVQASDSATTEISGRVLDPNGVPAAGAQVAWIDADRSVSITDGRLMAPRFGKREGGAIIETDERGHFRFEEEPNDGFSLLAAHDAGFALIGSEDFAQDRVIRLERWGRVEGRVAEGREPAGDKIWMGGLPNSTWFKHRRDYHDETLCDSEGQFTFKRVPPGWFEVGYLINNGDSSASLTSRTPVVVAPGETATVTLGGEGRPVIGRFVPPPDWEGPIYFGAGLRALDTARPDPPRPADYDQMTQRRQQEWLKQWHQTPEAEEYLKAVWHNPNQRHYTFCVADDGTFRIEDVIPGKYSLTVWLEERFSGGGRLEEFGGYSGTVEVPPMDEAYSDDPLDVGDLVLRLRRPLHVGDLAPLFEAQTLDGKDIRLADYRDRFVLLSFWHPASHPELDRLKELHASYGATGQFQILGLGGSDTLEEVKKFVAEQDVKWPQIYFGQAWDQGIAKQYGLSGLPYILLIDPDGKIVATWLREEKLTDTVREALAAFTKD